MIEWVRQQGNELNSLMIKRDAIRSGGDRLWRSLCEAIKECVASYEHTQYQKILKSSGCNDHTVQVALLEPVESNREQGAKIESTEVNFDRDKSVITARYLDGHTKVFPLDLVKEKVVLRFNAAKVVTGTSSLLGKTLTPEEAAREILDRVLFPELHENENRVPD